MFFILGDIVTSLALTEHLDSSIKAWYIIKLSSSQFSFTNNYSYLIRWRHSKQEGWLPQRCQENNGRDGHDPTICNNRLYAQPMESAMLCGNDGKFICLYCFALASAL